MSMTPPPSSNWKPLGPHSYRIEDDTLFIRMNGDATLESTVLYTELCRQLIAQNGYALSIVDLTISGSAPPEARRYQAQAVREFPPGCNEIAIYGVNRLARTFVQLTARAASVLTGKERTVEFVADEAEALQWRDERRRSMQARFGRS